VKPAIDDLAVAACAAPADLMRPTETEPDPGEPRDPVKGYQPDELYLYAQNLAEWGARGWNRVLDWQERERTIGPCPQPLARESVEQ
jgi:hypothetical protein